MAEPGPPPATGTTDSTCLPFPMLFLAVLQREVSNAAGNGKKRGSYKDIRQRANSALAAQPQSVLPYWGETQLI